MTPSHLPATGWVRLHLPLCGVCCQRLTWVPRESGVRAGHTRRQEGSAIPPSFMAGSARCSGAIYTRVATSVLDTHPHPTQGFSLLLLPAIYPIAQLFLAMTISGSWLVSLLNPMLEIAASFTSPNDTGSVGLPVYYSGADVTYTQPTLSAQQMLQEEFKE